MPATTQAPHRAHTVVSSPVGPLTLTSVDGILVGLYLDRQRYLPSAEAFGEPDASQFTEAARQLEAYFAGQLTEFTVPVTLIGTAFQRSVWTLLRTVPFGETTTYGELANLLGRPTAARAVGAANARNPIGIIVPCHRVVGSTGGLTGYSGGLERKEYLLALERNTKR